MSEAYERTRRWLDASEATAQRDVAVASLLRIRAAAESDAEVGDALRGFLVQETVAAFQAADVDPSGEQGEEEPNWRARAVAHAGALTAMLAAKGVVAGTFGETWIREAEETIRLDLGREPFCSGATALHKDGTLPATDTSKEEQSGVELIAAERARQVSEEGWTPDHDDSHSRGELRRAAICYARLQLGGGWEVPDSWPFEPESWKPRDDITCLVKAGALIAAEKAVEEFEGRDDPRGDHAANNAWAEAADFLRSLQQGGEEDG
jgi:hypothetical protein